jgi:hypothetical protein
MKRLYKYMSALAFTGILAMALTGNVYAQRGHGGHGGGGGGFHGASRGGGSRGGGSFRGGSSGFHGAVANRGGMRSNAGFHGAVRGAVGGRGAVGVRATAGFRGGVGVRGGAYAYRGGRYNYGGRTYYRGGGYRGGFRFGIGWGYPRIGFYYGVLPYGYYPFYWGSLPYYYYGGVFYRSYNGGYEVTTPPIGAAVPSLPSNAQSIVIDGIQYYEADGVYYQANVDNNGKTVYIVTGRDGVLNTDNSSDQPVADNDDPMDSAPVANNAQVQNAPQAQSAPQQANVAAVAKVGDVVNQLPPDCKKVTLNKKTYYVSPDNVFFEDYKDADGAGYRVASVPPPASDQSQY